MAREECALGKIALQQSSIKYDADKCSSANMQKI
jgi:hypothetical protein